MSVTVFRPGSLISRPAYNSRRVFGIIGQSLPDERTLIFWSDYVFWDKSLTRNIVSFVERGRWRVEIL